MEPGNEPSEPRLEASSWAIFAGALALYRLSFDPRSDGILLGNDVTPYAAALVHGSEAGLWNPHHLLFHPLAWAVFQLQRLFGGADHVLAGLAAQQTVAALGGALAVALVFRTAARLVGSARAVLFAGIFAYASGNWLYAAVGETYLPATAALTGLFALGLGERCEARPSAAWKVGAWLFLAVLLRQDSVLVVAVLPLLFPLRTWLPATAVAGLSALFTYFLVWWGVGLEAPFGTWLRGLAETGLWGGSPTASLYLQQGLVSVGVTGMAFSYPLLFAGPWRVLGAAACLGFLAAPLLARRDGWSGGPARALAALLAFALLRLAFFAWWQPTNMEYHAGTLLPLTLALVVASAPRPGPGALRVQSLFLAVLLAVVAIGNWTVLIGPNRGDDMARRAARAAAAAGRNGMVVSMDREQQYAMRREGRPDLTLFNAADTSAFPDLPRMGALRQSLRDVFGRGRRVVLARDTLMFPVRLRQGEHQVAKEFYEALFAEVEATILEEDEAGRAWLVELKEP